MILLQALDLGLCSLVPGVGIGLMLGISDESFDAHPAGAAGRISGRYLVRAGMQRGLLADRHGRRLDSCPVRASRLEIVRALQYE